MTQTIHGLFADDRTAALVIADLESAGFQHSDISLIANQVPRPDDLNHVKVRDALVDVAPDETLPGFGTAAGVGAATGATVGLMAAVTSLTIPVIGPIVAAGWLVSALVGAAAGTAVGGIVGVLTETGASGQHAEFYNDAIAKGGALVTLRASDEDVAKAHMVMARYNRILPPDQADGLVSTAEVVNTQA